MIHNHAKSSARYSIGKLDVSPPCKAPVDAALGILSAGVCRNLAPLVRLNVKGVAYAVHRCEYMLSIG